jgi:hypothetical protein
MKNLILAASLIGMSMTTFAASFTSDSAIVVKHKKKKKKGHKKSHHVRCEAYNG